MLNYNNDSSTIYENNTMHNNQYHAVITQHKMNSIKYTQKLPNRLAKYLIYKKLQRQLHFLIWTKYVIVMPYLNYFCWPRYFA